MIPTWTSNEVPSKEGENDVAHTTRLDNGRPAKHELTVYNAIDSVGVVLVDWPGLGG